MIVRLRTRVGIYASAMLLLVGVALTAHATQAVTTSQMQSYVLGVVGAAGAVVFGAFWILLITISGRSEKALMASVARLEAAVSDFKHSLDAHDGSPFAHRSASEHNHGPMVASIERIETTLERVGGHIAGLLAGQTTATAELAEQDVRLEHVEKGLSQLLTEHCLLHGRQLQRRDGDPADVDLDKLRGKQ